MHPLLISLLDIFLPATCLGCSADLRRGAPQTHICSSCLADIHWLDSEMILDETWLYASTNFGGVIRRLLHALKYGGRIDLGNYLGQLWALRCPFDPDRIDAVAAVPMAGWKEWRRGYNQAELLAQSIAQEWGKPYIASALGRRWFSLSQTRFGRKRRIKNAEQSYYTTHAASVLKGKTILLIDDICTTGATLESCAALLRKAGCRRVLAGTIAREK